MKSNKIDKVKEITKKLEEGLKELFESEQYKKYLNTMSKFHNYSYNNSILILLQKPDATMIAGYKSWEKNFKRHVKKGEKGIKILAPTKYKHIEEVILLDPKTNNPIIDKNGKTKTEKKEIEKTTFMPTTVFDISQTEGEEIPTIGKELTFDVKEYKSFINAIEQISLVPIEYEELKKELKGYFSPKEQRIVIQKDMKESQTIKTAIHELAHSYLHDKEVKIKGIEKRKTKRSDKEVEAESIAYTICQHFGIDTSDYSFAYIAGWSSGKEMPELKQSMETIQKASTFIITSLEKQLRLNKLKLKNL